jgi:hypothetical protein
MIEHGALLFVLLGAGVFLLAGALSPIESFAWWAGWFDEQPSSIEKKAPGAVAPQQARSGPFVVYLAGIDSISGDVMTKRAEKLLDDLKRAAPGATIVSDVFPYAPSGRPLLSGPRLFLWAWRYLTRLKLDEKSHALAYLINLRNLYQVLVSADHRYGPIFNAGASSVILEALVREGYDLRSGAPIFIIGYSGGGQIAIGAAEYLKAATNARIAVISIGGIMASSPGIAAIDHIHHFYGARDRVHKLGAIMFPERWKIFPHSQWNLAMAEGRIESRVIGGMAHDGDDGYLGETCDAYGVSYLAKTVRAIASVLACGK